MTAVVVRKWNATVPRAELDDWVRSFVERVLGRMRAIGGFREARILAEHEGDPAAVTVLTTWDDMAAITEFAGDDASRAVIPDFMQRFFVEADERASFHDVLLQETAI